MAGRESRRELLRGAGSKHCPGHAWDRARAIAGPRRHLVADEEAIISERVAEFGEKGVVGATWAIGHGSPGERVERGS